MKKYITLITGALRDLHNNKLTSLDEAYIEQENLNVSAGFCFLLAILEIIYFVAGIFYYAPDLKGHMESLLSVAFCGVLCVVYCSLAQRLAGKELDKKKIRLILAFLYWTGVAWAIYGSIRHYRGGMQMLLFDAVQIFFALLIYVAPLRAAIRVFGAYAALYYFLWNIDKAAGIQIVNYCTLALLIYIGYMVHYLQKLRAIAQKATIAEKNLDLAFDSTHDGLTGMKNRMALRNDFPGYIGKDLYVVMTDVDKFKQYNDLYGHDVGDRVLMEIGRQTLELFGYDCVYRYGGDEFLFILEKSQFDNVQELLLVWEHDQSTLKIKGLNSKKPIHCSYGVIEGFAESTEVLRNMILRADTHMYRMKRGGEAEGKTEGKAEAGKAL